MVGYQNGHQKRGLSKTVPKVSFLKKPAFHFCGTETGAFEYDNFIHNKRFHDLHISQIHFICRSEFCVSIVIYFSWEQCYTQEEFKTEVIQSFGGQTKYMMGDVQTGNVL